ncbi:periplasmic tail-specific proteinase [hydrothermal vent metagenome]|uniref:Periplasmic tail-specific proteinase n=1 Tax=hydrothermal vent metagenome TaxID=652676 RepID=A0A3B1DX50_9ZZZZ
MNSRLYRSKSFVLGMSLSLGLALLVGTAIWAQGNNDSDKTTAKLVTEMLERNHISRSKVNDEISKKFLKKYLKTLDSQKMYFLQSEIDTFKKEETLLDDQVKKGDVKFAYTVFNAYREHLYGKIKLSHQLIDAKQDFSANETISNDSKNTTWAQSKNDLNERWRKRIKYEFLLLKLDDKKDDEIRKQLHKRYRMLKRFTKDFENNEILEIYLSSLTHCFDPHSTYMSQETVEDFRIQMSLSLDGIGASLRSEDGYTIVANVVEGGAAAKDGRLKKDDKIIAVDSGDGKWVDIVEMKLSKVVRFIRGKRGTKVRLKVKVAQNEKGKKEGEKEKEDIVKVYELTRQKIELKSSAVKGEIIETKDRVTGTNLKIGVIDIPSFYRDFRGAQLGLKNFKSTARDTRNVLNDFKKKGGVDCVIIDLRSNGGGSLTESIEVSGLFINRGPVVMVKQPYGEVRSHEDTDKGVAYDGPLVVLCNRLSASASEIFAGAIKDYKRGIIVGNKTTHGKGTVQNIMPVSKRMFGFAPRGGLGALKLTINQFYRVNGDSTQNRGVTSDVVLPSILDHMELGESFLDNALAFSKIDAVKHENYALTSSEIISQLKKSSQQRVTANEKFQELEKQIKRYLVRKERKKISLNLAVLRKEREEDKKLDKENEKKKKEAEAKANGKGPLFPKGYYNDEVLSIAIDYANQSKNAKTANK